MENLLIFIITKVYLAYKKVVHHIKYDITFIEAMVWASVVLIIIAMLT